MATADISRRVILSFSKNDFAFFGQGSMKRRELADLMTEEHENDDGQECKDREEGHHAIHPADAHRFDPGVNVEIDTQAQPQPHRIEHQCSFDCVRAEALADVVYGNWNEDQRSDGHKELPDRYEIESVHV